MMVRTRFAMYLIERHTAGEHLFAPADAGSEHDVDDARFDEANHVWHKRTVVLIVRVQHHDDVGLRLQRQPVTCLLIAAVSAVFRVAMDTDSEFPRHFSGVVGARVVDENDVLARAARHPIEGRLQCFRRVIRGQDDADGEILYFRKMIRQSREYTSIIFAIDFSA